ncbi:hypothetical protein NDN01_18010 [Sphingomonas sp. QA11]|uniref:hypothetical protein n=1 Tax=Sphingomonas sp. QA11 TaxID=2950605 RepID=UPI003FA79CA1|nr:hypothetical protein NDN01_18010 [Sphingomonas sp. QA11]
MQTDPMGYADGVNWYNYVGSDPMNSVDPLGLQTCPRKGNKAEIGCEVVMQPAVTPDGNGGNFSDGSGRSVILNGTLGHGGVGGGAALAGGGVGARASQKPNDDPNCKLALTQDGDIAFEATTGSLVVLGGITGSRGSFINLRTGTTGSFFSVGAGGGADIGTAEVVGTASSLALLNQGGASFNASAGIATFSANGSLGKGGITPAGKSAGLGLGTLKVGLSLTASGTRLYDCKVRGE